MPTVRHASWPDPEDGHADAGLSAASAGKGSVVEELLGGDDPPDAIAAMSGDAAARAGLTTVRQSLRDQGRRCAEIALGHPQAPAARHPHGWEVIQRASTRHGGR